MPQLRLDQLSRRERQIMDILFENRDLSAQDIRARLPDPPSYSTVRALLARLLEKEVLGFHQDGAKYRYFPLMEPCKVQKSAISRLLKTFFQGSRAKAVNALLDSDDGGMSAEEVNELERKIKKIKSMRQSGAEVAGEG